LPTGSILAIVNLVGRRRKAPSIRAPHTFGAAALPVAAVRRGRRLDAPPFQSISRRPGASAISRPRHLARLRADPTPSAPLLGCHFSRQAKSRGSRKRQAISCFNARYLAGHSARLLSSKSDGSGAMEGLGCRATGRVPRTSTAEAGPGAAAARKRFALTGPAAWTGPRTKQRPLPRSRYFFATLDSIEGQLRRIESDGKSRPISRICPHAGLNRRAPNPGIAVAGTIAPRRDLPGAALRGRPVMLFFALALIGMGFHFPPCRGGAARRESNSSARGPSSGSALGCLRACAITAGEIREMSRPRDRSLTISGGLSPQHDPCWVRGSPGGLELGTRFRACCRARPLVAICGAARPRSAIASVLPAHKK